MLNTDKSQSHDAIRSLLPWYLNGTLADAEREYVRAHLVECPECQADADLHREMQAVACKVDATPILPNRNADQLLDGAQTRSPRIAGSGRIYKFAIAAAAALLAVGITSFIGVSRNGVNNNEQYTTVTTPDSPSSMDYVFQIRFRDGVPATDRERIFGEVGGLDILPTDDPDLYKVTVRLEAKSMEQLEKFSAEMRSREEISSIEVIALQLPMR